MELQYRYEMWTKNGKEFTKWIGKCQVNDEKEAKLIIKNCPKEINKLKYEYRTVNNKLNE